MVGGAHEGRIDGKFRERRLAWKKGSWPRHIPVPLSNVSAPGVFTSIPYLIDSDAVFWSYYTRFKTNKAKICIHMGRAYYGPIFVFCTRFLMLPFLLNLSFFIKHDEILSWPPTCPAMHEVMRSFGAIKTKTHLLFAFDARFRVCTFWSASTQRKHSVFARRFQRVRSEKNLIEGALMTKRP